MSSQTILVVDDEPKLVDVVRAYLERDGYRVVTAGDGRSALEQFHRAIPDLIILDLMLPQVDGLEVCRRIRQESRVPIIMLTARAEAVDELLGLELGADDYVTKPFSPRAILARVRAVLRRVNPSLSNSEAPIIVGALRVDLVRHEVMWHTRPLALTPGEFRLVAALAQHPGRVYSRAELLEAVQGDSFAGYERTIDAHVKNLRKKLVRVGGEAAAASIVAVPGIGYKLEAHRA